MKRNECDRISFYFSCVLPRSLSSRPLGSRSQSASSTALSSLEYVECDRMSANVWMNEWPCNRMNKFMCECVNVLVWMASRNWVAGHSVRFDTFDAAIPRKLMHTYIHTNVGAPIHTYICLGMCTRPPGFILLTVCCMPKHFVHHAVCCMPLAQKMWHKCANICRALSEFLALLRVRMPSGVAVTLQWSPIQLYTHIWKIIYSYSVSVDWNEFMNCLWNYIFANMIQCLLVFCIGDISA